MFLIWKLFLGLAPAWPLFAIGAGSFAFAILVTIIMIIKFVPIRKNRDRKLDCDRWFLLIHCDI